jgi:hypothetical protein
VRDETPVKIIVSFEEQHSTALQETTPLVVCWSSCRALALVSLRRMFLTVHMCGTQAASLCLLILFFFFL